ncbi:Fc.00g084570.m01.CDS01 [Cosmosporella sp. VM-42]
MAPLDKPSIPKGSTILVTGVNGLLGSNIADRFLHYGYKVRGVVRDLEKSAWLAALFDKRYGAKNFELVVAGDMVAEGAYGEVVKGADFRHVAFESLSLTISVTSTGVSAVVHTASPMSMDPNPNNIIPIAIAGAVNALKAAYSEPSVKRFVLTSSSAATVMSSRDTPGITVTEDTWNEDSVKAAWAEPPYGMERYGAVYCASKTQGEQEVWKFHRENQHKRPDLVVNSVLPNMNFGKSLDVVNQGFPSTSGMVAGLWNKDEAKLKFLSILAPQEYFINTQDTGRLHVAAALFPNVKNERIFAFAGRFSFDTILEIMRKAEPERKFPDNFSGGDDPNEIKPQDRAEQLLRELGEPGWVSLEDTILEAVEQFRTLD